MTNTALETNELRIGNYFTQNGIRFRVSEITRQGVVSICSNGKDEVTAACPTPKPIKLTNELLEDMGFEKADSFHEEIEYKYQWTDGSLFFYETFDRRFIFDYTPIELKYVHQLQNLYYSLTGKELSIDKTTLKN